MLVQGASRNGVHSTRQKALRALRKILGTSHYAAHAGSFTGGANGVYWMEIVGTRPGGLAIIANITQGAKRKIPATQAAVEIDLLYPLLRGRDLQKWAAAPSAYILMTQDAKKRQGIDTATMQDDYPKAHAYLKRFEKELLARKDRGTRGLIEKGAPFWSIFSVADYTFAPGRLSGGRLQTI